MNLKTIMNVIIIAGGTIVMHADTKEQESLLRWSDFALEQINEQLGTAYAPGRGHWSIQANSTSFAALAVAGKKKEALQVLDYIVSNHVSSGTGKQWGESWISALAIERMMHGIELLKDDISPETQAKIKKMMIREADWLLDKYEVVAAIDNKTGKNKPESNIWNGCILHRTALMYPELPRAAEYRKKGTLFLLNGISIPSDAKSIYEYDGKALKDWHIGANFTEEMGLNHHGYMNVGYMVICLSNIAMFHFACKENGWQAPEALYHNTEKLWKLVKLLTCEDGRLWRVGGDTRVRYCYCQDYAVPMWLFAADYLKDKDAEKYLENWRKIVSNEQDYNGNGSFLGKRLTELYDASPLYYLRLEGDRAVTLSMYLKWRGLCNKKSLEDKYSECGGWYDSFHGAAVERSQKRLVSWVWEAAGKASCQMAPADSSDMLEWTWNGIGKIEGSGFRNYPRIIQKKLTKTDGGFYSSGILEWVSEGDPAEGTGPEQVEITAQEYIAAFALPDDRTMVIVQKAVKRGDGFLKTVKGVFWQMPNDIYNDSKRTYLANGKTFIVKGGDQGSKGILKLGDSVCIDGKINLELLSGGESLSLYSPGKRQVKINGDSKTYGRSGGNLYCDEICSPCKDAFSFYKDGTVLFENVFVVSLKDGEAAYEKYLKHDENKLSIELKSKKEVYLMNVEFIDKAGKEQDLCNSDFSVKSR